MRIVCPAAMATMLVLVSQDAFAQTRNDETRRASLIQQATQARSQGRWSAVAELLQQVIEIRATASVRLGLAGALQELGRYQEAATQATLCMQTASTDRDLREEQRTALVDGCGQVLRDSTANLASVTVEVSPEGVTGATLSVDGEPVEGFAAGRPFYLTPGRRRFTLAAPNHSDSETVLTTRAGVASVLRLELHPGAATVPSAPVVTSNVGSRPTGAYILGLSGVGAVGVGVILRALVAEEALDDIRARCSLSADLATCPASEVDNASSLRGVYYGASYSGIGLIVGGGISIAASVVWLLVTGSGRDASRRSIRFTQDGAVVEF